MKVIKNVFTEDQRKKFVKEAKPLIQDGETLNMFYGRFKTPAKPSHLTVHLIPEFRFYHTHILDLIKKEMGLDLKCIRSWINLTNGYKKDILWHAHNEYDYSMVYYMQTFPFFSNGTKFKDHKLVKAPQNSMLVFDSKLVHTAPSSPLRFDRYTFVMDLLLKDSPEPENKWTKYGY